MLMPKRVKFRRVQRADLPVRLSAVTRLPAVPSVLLLLNPLGSLLIR